MNNKLSVILSAVSILNVCQLVIADTTPLSLIEEKKLTLEQQLGQQIFFDKNLSSPAGQSCASCHDIKTSLTDPAQQLPVSLGAVAGRTGTRNAPSAAYSAFAPNFHFNAEEGLYIGGQFLDGRAINLKEQAKGPFLNPDEMNNADEQSVINKIKVSTYINLFKQVYGEKILEDVAQAYDGVAQAIVAFENTSSFNRFTSKYDYYLSGRVNLSAQEQKGLELFEDENKGNCAACHISQTSDESQPLFTDFTYDNLGTPSNPDILALKGAGFVDVGLGETVGSVENGKFKVPSLRNVAKTAPYMHNGVFSNLKQVVEFYNTRDIDDKWAAPEVAENVNTDELGDLGLTDEEVEAIVIFMRTLTDGYQFNDMSVYSVKGGRIDIPYVRTEGAHQADRFYALRLQVTKNAGVYEVQQFDKVLITNFSMIESMPLYNFDTEVLELPELLMIDSAGLTGSYTAQLKMFAKNSEKVYFKLLYAKKIQ